MLTARDYPLEMQICHSLSELSTIRQPIHWAAGFFDGVHRGHQQVIASADTPEALRGVLCFEPHPLAILRPDAQPLLLTPNSPYKASLFRSLGVDILLLLPFDSNLATLSAASFMDRLCSACQVAGISVGANWHFGQGGSGDASFLLQESKSVAFVLVSIGLSLQRRDSLYPLAVSAELFQREI